jgi:hypothetical protein
MGGGLHGPFRRSPSERPRPASPPPRRITHPPGRAKALISRVWLEARLPTHHGASPWLHPAPHRCTRIPSRSWTGHPGFRSRRSPSAASAACPTSGGTARAPMRRRASSPSWATGVDGRAGTPGPEEGGGGRMRRAWRNEEQRTRRRVLAGGLRVAAPGLRRTCTRHSLGGRVAPASGGRGKEDPMCPPLKRDARAGPP